MPQDDPEAYGSLHANLIKEKEDIAKAKNELKGNFYIFLFYRAKRKAFFI